jgi:hypothetical protein
VRFSNLEAVYESFLNQFTSVPAARVICDGTGYATSVPAIGGDANLSGVLFAVHDYTMDVQPPYLTEAEWANHISGFVGNYSNRTIDTEWGHPCSPGSDTKLLSI